MAQVELYRCLVISPGDVSEARLAVQNAIAFWNAHVGKGRKAFIEAVMWESHARPEVGGHPQEIINRQLVDDCQIGLAVFWTRLGSPTHTYASGSVEEIERLHKSGAEVMVYFSDEPVKPSSISTDQLQKLQAFRADFQKKALVQIFSSTDELQRLVTGHLTSLIDTLLRKESAAPDVVEANRGMSSSGTPTAVSAPKPDIRVKVSAGLPMPSLPDPRLKALIFVAIENHSPADFFFGGTLVLVLNDGSVAQLARDGVSGEWLSSRVVKPGDSISYRFSAQALMEAAEKNGRNILFARVNDKIGREYESDPAEMALVLHNARTILRSGR